MNRLVAMILRHRWSLLGIVILGVPLILVFSRWLTGYVEGDSFRQKISRTTSNGLKIQGRYETIRRTGFLTVTTPGFRGDGGEHTMKSLETTDVEADFNPAGFILKRWQFDEIRIRRGIVELQQVEGGGAEPERKPKPWYFIFLPNRVYLKKTLVESADILWMFRGKRAGIYDLRLLIRPDGRDFEYWGENGKLRMSWVPELRVQSIHTLIRKPRMDLYEAVLVPLNPNPIGSLVIHGKAGLQKDRTVEAALTFHDMPLAPWLPERWRSFVEGTAAGQVDWHGEGTKLKESSASGRLEISAGRLHGLPSLQSLSTITGNKAFLDFHVDLFHLDMEWKDPKFRTEKVSVESRGLFRIEGNVAIENKVLSGTLQLGVTRDSLKNFPGAEQKIFTREAEGYFWTPVQLSGTLDKPQQDLSPRMTALLWDSPGAFFATLFRMLGDWFKGPEEKPVPDVKKQ